MQEHNHTHVTSDSDKETLALLEYMLGHNRHHAEELHELSHKLPENEAILLHSAVDDFRQGNEKLARVLADMKGE